MRPFTFPRGKYPPHEWRRLSRSAGISEAPESSLRASAPYRRAPRRAREKLPRFPVKRKKRDFSRPLRRLFPPLHVLGERRKPPVAPCRTVTPSARSGFPLPNAAYVCTSRPFTCFSRPLALRGSSTSYSAALERRTTPRVFIFGGTRKGADENRLIKLNSILTEIG